MGAEPLWLTELPRFCFPDGLDVVQDRVVVCCAGDVVIMDRVTGALVAQANLHPGSCKGSVAAEDGVVALFNALTLDGHHVTGRFQFAASIALDGTIGWVTPLPTLRSGWAIALGESGTVDIVGYTEGSSGRFGGALLTLSSSTGQVTHTRRLPGARELLLRAGDDTLVGGDKGSPGLERLTAGGQDTVIAERVLQVSAADGAIVAQVRGDHELGEPQRVVALDPADLSMMWSQPIDEHRIAVAGEHVLTTELRGETHVLTLRRARDGRVVWRADVAPPTLPSHPHLHGGYVEGYGQLRRRSDGAVLGEVSATTPWGVSATDGERLFVGFTQGVAAFPPSPSEPSTTRRGPAGQSMGASATR
jgi:hypothetical protein